MSGRAVPRLSFAIEEWPLSLPFRISGHVFDVIEVLVVELTMNGHVGRAEAAGIYYRGENARSMARVIERLKPAIEAGIDRDQLSRLLPPCGARNALDCALWDLHSALEGVPVWELAGLGEPRPLTTTFTCGAGSPEAMASAASAYHQARAIKLKLTGDPVDFDRVVAVREALPDVWLGVDANQGFTRPFLETLMPTLVAARVALIEQPFAVGEEGLLEGLSTPIPIAADESAQNIQDLEKICALFDVVNIKLDKCGGLTEALAMARRIEQLGRTSMVGNMLGTSLAMAPAFVVGQLCEVVDLDGPLFLANDRPEHVLYEAGQIMCPPKLWGNRQEDRPAYRPCVN